MKEIEKITQQITYIRQRISEIQNEIRPSGILAKPTQSFAEAVSNADKPVQRHRYDKIDPLINRAAEQNNIRYSLLKSLIQAESGGNPSAVSPKGAMGLMQLMPATAGALGVDDPYDPEQNIMGGARYLRQLLDRFNGDEKLALAAYNAGPGAVLRYNGVPPYLETQRYVNRVLSLAGQDNSDF